MMFPSNIIAVLVFLLQVAILSTIFYLYGWVAWGLGFLAVLTGAANVIEGGFYD